MNTTTIIATDTIFDNYIGKDRMLGRYPGALVAYSLREIGARYVGPLVRVFRSSDSAEMDFYAKNGAVDLNDIKNFVGTGDGFVTVWYDQSGNGLHAEQPVSASQPKIVSGGTVILFRSKGAVMFDGVNDALVIPDSVATAFKGGSSDLSVFTACIPSSNAAPFSVFTMSARTSATPVSNDLVLFQANGQFGSSTRKTGAALFRDTSTGNDKSAVGGTEAVSNAPLFLGFVRASSEMTINDQSTSVSTAGVVTADLEISMATMGATRRGTAGAVEGSNPNSKIAELIVYPKSYKTMMDDIISDMSAYYL